MILSTAGLVAPARSGVIDGPFGLPPAHDDGRRACLPDNTTRDSRMSSAGTYLGYMHGSVAETRAERAACDGSNDRESCSRGLKAGPDSSILGRGTPFDEVNLSECADTQVQAIARDEAAVYDFTRPATERYSIDPRPRNATRRSLITNRRLEP